MTPDERRAYQRAWIKRRRDDWIAANGPCVICGSPENLEVDHKDPTSKRLQPSGLWSLSLRNPKRIEELEKCQVLCHQCHVDKSTVLDGRTRGENNGNSILTANQVMELLDLRQSSNLTYVEISRLFGVSKSTVAKICQGRYWSHLTSGM